MDQKFFTLSTPRNGERPEPTYFFRRPDGVEFACDSKQASSIQKQARHKLIGVSDGQTFFKLFREAIQVQNKALEKLGEYPAGSAAAKRQLWLKKRRKIEADAIVSMNEAEAAEKAVAKKHKKIPPPDNRVTVFGDASSAMVSALANRR